MKTIYLWLITILITLVCLMTASPTQAQGGCPASLPEIGDYRVTQAIPVTPYGAETASPQTPNTFREEKLTLNHSAQERWFISSIPDGLAPTCVDDYIEISGLAGQKTFDYRSTDRTRIEFREPLATEITELLVPGVNMLVIRLVDVGNLYSNSALYLVAVEVLPPLSTITPAPAPATPLSDPTEAVAVVPTTAPSTPIPTPTAAPAISPEPIEPDLNPPFWFGSSDRLLWLIPGFLVGFAITLFAARRLTGPPVLTGELEFYKQGTYIKTVSLAEFKKPTLTLGSGTVDIWLPGDNLPEVAANLHTRRSGREIQTLVTTFAGSGEVVETRRLRHEDNLYLGDYRLVYKNYAETEPILPIGELNHA
ncbi:MAG: hypothetical protein KDJ97_13365 [Anaerolineae bacterium]|nr:hypothetical protein [Anaerolineae bacterium]